MEDGHDDADGCIGKGVDRDIGADFAKLEHVGVEDLEIEEENGDFGQVDSEFVKDLERVEELDV